MRTVFQIIETATGEVVHTVDVTGRSEREMDRIEMGLMRNMDLDRFHVDGPMGGFEPFDAKEPTP